MVIDLICAMVAVWGFYVGFSRGIIKTVFTVLSILFGLVAGFKFAPAATQFLETAFKNTNPLMFLAGFLLSFVVTMFVIRMVARLLEGFLKTANINVVNQAAGGALLAGVFILIYSGLLWFADQSTILNEEVKQESLTYDYLEEFPEQMQKLGKRFKPVFMDFWDRSVEMMDKIEEMSEREESVPEIRDLDE